MVLRLRFNEAPAEEAGESGAKGKDVFRKKFELQ